MSASTSGEGDRRRPPSNTVLEVPRGSLAGRPAKFVQANLEAWSDDSEQRWTITRAGVHVRVVLTVAGQLANSEQLMLEYGLKGGPLRYSLRRADRTRETFAARVVPRGGFAGGYALIESPEVRAACLMLDDLFSAGEGDFNADIALGARALVGVVALR